MLKRYIGTQNRFTKCTLHDDEEPVQSGLAMTPAQMAKLAEQGVPVAMENLSLQFIEGRSDIDYTDLTMDMRRGIDAAELWEEGQRIRKKSRKLQDRIDTIRAEYKKSE